MSTCFGCLITDLGSEETLVSKIDTIPDLPEQIVGKMSMVLWGHRMEKFELSGEWGVCARKAGKFYPRR